MGGDSSRRFYAGGRSRVWQAPLPLRDEAAAAAAERATQSQRKNAARQRRRGQQREEEEKEGAVERALERVKLNGGDAAAASQALVRMLTSAQRREECVRLGGILTIVAVVCASADLEVVKPCCRLMVRLCAGAAEQQAAAVSAGALTGLVAALLRHADDAHLVAACSRALEHVATGRDAAARRKAAADAGALVALVHATQRWELEEATAAACLAALRSLTRDCPALQDAARASGARAQWLV